jgi:hypothetical protein
MTQREKLLASSLMGVLLVFGGGFLFHLFVYQPVVEVRERLTAEETDLVKLQNEYDTKQREIDAILKVNPRLAWWSQISLPSRDPELKKLKLLPEEQKRKHLNNMRVAYESYLFKLMDDAKFRRGSIKVEVRQRSGGPAPVKAKGKEAPYEQLTFGIVGEGTMENVTEMLAAFHKTPLLHHIRTLSLMQASDKGKTTSDGRLKMDLTVDALVMAGGEERSTLTPTKAGSKTGIKPRVLAEPSRDYLTMNTINMFTGYKPTPVSERDTTTPTKQTERPADVLRFVRLTGILYDPERKRWEATLYDLAKGGREKVINTGSRDEFTIVDKDDNPMLQAKVIKVDEQYVVIQADGKYYRLQTGDFLYPATRKPISKSQLEELGITPDESENVKKKEK